MTLSLLYAGGEQNPYLRQVCPTLFVDIYWSVGFQSNPKKYPLFKLLGSGGSAAMCHGLLFVYVLIMVMFSGSGGLLLFV